MDNGDRKLFDYFPHPSKWSTEQSLVWIFIIAACAPLGVMILILSYRLKK